MLQRTHPIIMVAAIAVTLLSVVGIGVLTGVIPLVGAMNSKPQPSGTGMPPAVTAAGAAHTMIGSDTNAVDTGSPDTGPKTGGTNLKPIDKTTIGQPLAKYDSSIAPASPPKSATGSAKAPAMSVSSSSSKATPTPSYDPSDVANNSQSGRSTSTTTAGGNSATSSSDSRVVTTAKQNDRETLCADCGTVDSILPVREQAKGSGVGAVIGGVVGGVLGHQVGSGRGRDVATVAGAVGGAVLGNSIEKSNSPGSQHVEIRVRLGDGTFRTVKADNDQGLRMGDKVQIKNGRVSRIL